jgi:hypothetical protein
LTLESWWNTRLAWTFLPAILNFPTCLASTPAFSRPPESYRIRRMVYVFLPLKLSNSSHFALVLFQGLRLSLQRWLVFLHLLCMRRIRTLSCDRPFNVHQSIHSKPPESRATPLVESTLRAWCRVHAIGLWSRAASMDHCVTRTSPRLYRHNSPP